MKEKIKQLTDKLNYYGKLYYEEDNPEISDYEYDMLLNQLKELENQHPSLIMPHSPLDRKSSF